MTDKEFNDMLRGFDEKYRLNFNLYEYEKLREELPLLETIYAPYHRGNKWVYDRELPRDFLTPWYFEEYDIPTLRQMWRETYEIQSPSFTLDMRNEYRRHARRRARMLGCDLEKDQPIPKPKPKGGGATRGKVRNFYTEPTEILQVHGGRNRSILERRKITRREGTL